MQPFQIPSSPNWKAAVSGKTRLKFYVPMLSHTNASIVPRVKHGNIFLLTNLPIKNLLLGRQVILSAKQLLNFIFIIIKFFFLILF